MNSYPCVVAIHTPEVKIKYDNAGGVDIILDDFVYVHINYDYRYTSNAARTVLANEIVKILTIPSPTPTATAE